MCRCSVFAYHFFGFSVNLSEGYCGRRENRKDRIFWGISSVGSGFVVLTFIYVLCMMVLWYVKLMEVLVV